LTIFQSKGIIKISKNCPFGFNISEFEGDTAMNNEEKILAMLEKLEQGQIELQQGQIQTNTRLDKLQEDVTDIHDRLVKVEVTQEHDVLKGIQLLNEGHVAIDRKLNALDIRTKDVDDIRDNVEVLKHVVRNK